MPRSYSQLQSQVSVEKVARKQHAQHWGKSAKSEPINTTLGKATEKSA